MFDLARVSLTCVCVCVCVCVSFVCPYLFSIPQNSLSDVGPINLCMEMPVKVHT